MAEYLHRWFKRFGLAVAKPVLAVACLIFGMLVILAPNLLVLAVGLFLMMEGIRLLVDSLEQEPRSTVTLSEAVYCSSCGTGNTDEAVYCQSCGKRLVQAEQVAMAQQEEVVQ